MGEVERIEELPHDPHRLIDSKGLVLVKEAAELASLDELHYEIRELSFYPEVVDLHDVRVVKARGRFRLAHEPRRVIARHIRSKRLTLPNRLDRDLAAQRRVIAVIHNSHTPLAEGMAQLIAA